MLLKKLCVCVSLVAISGCATVDVTNVATGDKTAETVEKIDQNVVVKASNKLYATYIKRGWIQAGNIKNAAMVLLKGSKAKEGTSTRYAETVTDISRIRADIAEATGYAEKTVKAADVFLTVADNDEALNRELKSLEKALIACRKAEATFKTALYNASAADVNAELSHMTKTVDNLRDITDNYGDRVRGQISSDSRAL